MKPYAILMTALAVALGLEAAIAGWAGVSVASLAAVGIIGGLYLQVKVAPTGLDCGRVGRAYTAGALAVLGAVILDGLASQAPAAEIELVSVFYNGTCETLHVVKAVPGALVVYDGSSYAYLRRDDITGISTEPGCGTGGPRRQA